jgi:hypothetical protein
MSDEHDHQAPAVRTLLLAAQICGGTDALAAALKVAQIDLKAWIAGQARTPNEVFLGALDIVADGPFGLAAIHRDHASAERAQARADRLQAAADRVRASADRIQLAADRAREIANQSRGAGDATPGMDELQRIADWSKKNDSPTS